MSCSKCSLSDRVNLFCVNKFRAVPCHNPPCRGHLVTIALRLDEAICCGIISKSRLTPKRDRRSAKNRKQNPCLVECPFSNTHCHICIKAVKGEEEDEEETLSPLVSVILPDSNLPGNAEEECHQVKSTRCIRLLNIRVN